MNHILWIDACVRKESRTRLLAEHVLSKLEGTVTKVDLDKEKIQPLTGNALAERSKKAEEGAFTDPVFRYALQLKDADEIVISAPYWDLSFPAVLKTYLEAINIVGLTFCYTEDNRPVSMIKAKRLIYITTAGGEIVSDEPGFGYVRLVMNEFYGVCEFLYFKAENLDIIGSDPEDILNETRKEIDRTFLEEKI